MPRQSLGRPKPKRAASWAFRGHGDLRPQTPLGVWWRRSRWRKRVPPKPSRYASSRPPPRRALRRELSQTAGGPRRVSRRRHGRQGAQDTRIPYVTRPVDRPDLCLDDRGSPSDTHTLAPLVNVLGRQCSRVGRRIEEFGFGGPRVARPNGDGRECESQRKWSQATSQAAKHQWQKPNPPCPFRRQCPRRHGVVYSAVPLAGHCRTAGAQEG